MVGAGTRGGRRAASPDVAKQLAVGRAPVLEIEKQVSQFQDVVIADPPLIQQSLDPLVGRPCLRIGPHAGPVGTEPHVGDRANAVGFQSLEEASGLRPP